jgi:hypothetical protein
MDDLDQRLRIWSKLHGQGAVLQQQYQPMQ